MSLWAVFGSLAEVKRRGPVPAAFEVEAGFGEGDHGKLATIARMHQISMYDGGECSTNN